VVAIKEASGSVEQVSDIASLCGLPILSGDDSLTLPMMAVGATGVVSVLSNVLPGEVVRLVAAAAAGDYATARAEHLRLLPLVKHMFIETNPVPVKRALAAVGICGAAVRLPLVALAPESEAKLLAVLRAGKVVDA
jgi:4-hydroxy-tetrahydrodipicolinate synthase